MDAHNGNPVISGLRDLYNSSPAAREIMTSFSDWENKKVTSVKRVHRRLERRGTYMPRPEIAQFFQTLHTIGLGEFIADGVRRPRFVWGYPLQELPRVASGEAWELAPLPTAPANDPATEEEAADGAVDEDGAEALAQDDALEPDEDPTNGALELDEDDILHESAQGRPMLKHIYRLRGDYVVKLRLPMDLTSTEANRLADFIKTLPFGS
jgi:hypothetical protein